MTTMTQEPVAPLLRSESLELGPELRRMSEQVRAAAARGRTLCIRGSGSKDFYGQPPQGGSPLDTTAFAGIVSHQPTELVVTARAGTPLHELEAALEEHGQALPFEPPHFDGAGTVGGMVAAGLSGPARAATGAVRDFVLGASLLDGRGEVLQFGGEVMKNVAGYDVSRLLAGSMGLFGVILEVSLKVLPVSPATATLRFDCDQPTALAWLNEWGGQPLPLNASAWWDGTLVVRLRGALAAVQTAMVRLRSQHGAEVVEVAQGSAFWQGLRHHTDEYFLKARNAVERGAALWRLSVPQTAPPIVLSGEQLVEWHGAQRWWCTAQPAAQVRQAAAAVGGHAVLFRARDKSPGAFAPLSAPVERIHRELKQAFDPAGVFNPGRLYPGL
jgi:glycolate oxidase FAD binding subunit